MLTIAQWKTYVESGVNAILTAAGLGTFDFYDGDVSAVFSTIMAYCCNYVQSAVYWFIDQAFIMSSSGVYLRRHAQDFDVTVNSGSKATGSVTFSRVSTSGTVVIPSSTQVITDPSLAQSLVFLTTAIGTLNPGDASVTVAIEAYEEGSDYNLEADSIRFFVTPIAGIDDITNASATTGGVDEDTDLDIRENIQTAIQNLARATPSAVEYACTSVSGVDSICIIERPDGEIHYRIDDPNVVLNGTFSSVTNTSYYYGIGKSTTTPTDYIEFTFKNEETIAVSWIGQATASLVEIFIDGVSKGQVNIETALTTFESSAYSCTLDEHVLKIVLISGTMATDGFIGTSTSARDGVLKIYVDDGSGTASWTLLNSVISAVEDFRACGIRYYVVRSEVYVLDISVSVLWNTSPDKPTTKSQIATDLANYLAAMHTGEIVYKNNLYGFFNYQTVAGRKQILNVTISTPLSDIALQPEQIVRLGTITYTDVTS